MQLSVTVEPCCAVGLTQAGASEVVRRWLPPHGLPTPWSVGAPGTPSTSQPSVCPANSPSPVWPLASLGRVDPDLAAGGEQQAGEGLTLVELGRTRRNGQILNVANVDPEASVGDVLDRHRQGLAVP